jgi:hypothetical protein
MTIYELLAIVVLVLDIFAIISVAFGHSSVLRKVAWVVVIPILPVIGVVLYFLVGRSPQDA